MTNKKFNIVFSNPPYNKNLDLKILEKIVPLADELIVVHPCNWIFENKPNQSQLYKRCKIICNNQTRNIILIDGNKCFHIRKPMPCQIIHIDNNYIGTCMVKNELSNKKYEVVDINDITTYNDNWCFIKSFMKQIEDYCKINGDICTQREKNNETEYVVSHGYVKQADMRNDIQEGEDRLQHDFYYSLLLKDKREYENYKKGKMNYYFQSEQEQNNFAKYLKSKFVRFCLSLYKINAHLGSKHTKIIPLLDFTKEWTDKKLFKYFEVSDELKEYIEDFIPNYYKEDYD